jgi:uncharacterized membrane protein YkvA (DUF1232 family)
MDSKWCLELADEGARWWHRHRPAILQMHGPRSERLGAKIEALVSRVRRLGESREVLTAASSLHAAAALLYVVNRFDEIFDVHGPSGLADDVKLVLGVAAH